MKFDGADTEIRVQSNSVKLGDSFREHARAKIVELSARYFNRLTICEVHLKTEGSSFECTISVKAGALPMMSASYTAHDIYQSFNECLSKIGHQLRKKKDQLRDDKPVRVDKEAVLQDGIRGEPVRSMTDEFDPEPPPMDDYSRALLQKSQQDDRRLAADSEAARWSRQGLPLAAE